MSVFKCVCTLLILLIPLSLPALYPSAFAHDFWIETTVRESTVDVALRLGHVDAPESVRRADKRIVRFDVGLPDGSNKPVVGQDGAEPAGILDFVPEHGAVVTYQSNHAFSTLAPAKFEAYLLEEGLEHVIKRRKLRNETHLPGSEAYLRCAKAIVGLTRAPLAFLRKPTGLPAELVWLSDVNKARQTHSAQFLMLVDGKPAKGVRVVAKSAADHDKKIGKRTGADGTVRLKLPHGGRWIVTAVYMKEMPKGANPAWESLWASLTFEL